MKRCITAILLLAMLVSSVAMLSSCKLKTNDLGVIPLEYYDQTGPEGYSNLFYRNDLLLTAADPCCIYVTEGEYEGWFFLYASSDELSCNGYQCWKSKDLTSWEYVGVCFMPEKNSWSRQDLWAPEVIYDEEYGKYILVYNGTNTNQAGGYVQTHYIGMAYSDSPAGPFIQYTGTNQNGTEIGLGDPIFDVELLGHDHPLYKRGTGFIDAHPFIDPVTGDRYLYFVRTRNVHTTNIVVGVKMIDWATPDYSTYHELVTVNRTTYNGDEITEKTEGTINEAPNVLYHNGKYYLTLSVNGASDKDYGVIQAISDSPLGPYEKIQASEGGLVNGADVIWDHVSCVGSHSFVQAGDEFWTVYHQNRDRDAGGTMNRGIACDRVVWTKNEDGLDVLKAIGPTYSPQPKPAVYTGYKNIAPLASVSATNALAGSSVDYLNDGIVKLHDPDNSTKEFDGNGLVTITMSFDEYVTAKALLLYNSAFYENAFYQVNRIDLSFRKEIDGEEYTGVARVENLYYDFEAYSQIDYEIMRPGAPLILEFDELEVNEITIYINCPSEQEYVSVSEIMVLGKEVE